MSTSLAESGVAAESGAAAQTFAPVTTARRTFRRLRLPLGLLAVIVVVALVGAFLQGASSGSDLDPTSYSQGGSRALATLLAQRGSPVTRVDDVPGAVQGTAAVKAVVIPDSGLLGDAALRAALLVAVTRPVLLVVTDDGFSPDALGLSIAADDADSDQEHDPHCALPAAVAAGQARTGSRTFDPDKLPAGFTLQSACYDSTLLALRPADGAGELVILGSPSILENRELSSAGDAALALSLIDHAGPVAWVQPRPGTSAGDGTETVTQLLPHRLKVAAWELGVVALLLALWQGRRLGPVVLERLPVSVRSAETVRGRARLYRGAGARDRAALALREGARARLATRLGLGPQTRPAALVAAVAERSGRTQAQAGTLLYGSGTDPVDDLALVRLADDLDTLVLDTLVLDTLVPDTAGKEAQR